MKTRFLSLFLALVMIISVLPVNTLADGASGSSEIAVLSVDTISAKASEEVEISVNIENNPGILGATLTLSWDSMLSLTDYEVGEVFSELTFVKPSQLISGCNFVWYGNEITNITDDNVLTLKFKVSAQAESGDTLDVNVSYISGDVVDKNYAPVELNIVNGGVEVISYIPGDVNDDGRINPLDLIKLSQYISDGGRTNPDGYNAVVNIAASDVNDDTRLNPLDLIMLSQYISDGCKTDPDGYNVTLKPSAPRCDHTTVKTQALGATCTEEGNIEYWTCTKCNKLYEDEAGTKEIKFEDTVVEAKGHTYSAEWSFDQTYHWHAATCEHNNLVNDKAEHSYGNDNICDICLAANTPDPTKPYKITYELYEYNQNTGDSYLPTAYIDNSMNPSYYSSTDSFDVKNPICAGYKFLGWFTADGDQVTQIKAGTNKNLTLQARWEEIPYDIVYRLFKTPVEDTIEEKYKTYTARKGLVDMPNPEIYNYIFLGWYTDDGVEVTNIPIGTTGDIALNAFFVSKRNLAKPVANLDDPVILENTDEGIIYFAYELGTIENVPLATLETYENIVGLKQIVSKEYTWSVSNQRGEEITDTISKSTVDSGTWSWSENWSDVLQVSEEWAEEHGMTQTEAKEAIKTTTDGYSNTYSEGEQVGTNVTDGVTTLNYNSTNTTDLESVETNVEMGVTASTKVNAGFMKGEWEVSVSGGVNNKNSTETNKHTGTDTTNVDTTVTENSSSWNDETTKEHSEQLSTSESVTNALSEIISNTKGYGKSYAKGGEGSESFDSSTSESSTSSASSTMTFTTAKSKTTTTTIEIDADTMKEGSYRLTIGGTMHVFAVVGYDIANKSYFHYTYNVMDDTVKTFFDYSCDNSFSDHEYSVLPFEIPYYVHEYVSSKIAVTEGVRYQTNSTTGTAKILKYEGSSTDILIPTYISAGGTAYKVTEISPNAFAGNASIKTVILSEYIDEIPDEAFKGCTSLEEISGFYTKIGYEAFSGCSNLKTFSVSSTVSKIGEKAFTGVKQINVTVLSADNAIAIAESRAALGATENEIIADAQVLTRELVNAAVNSGADTVILDISHIISGTKFNIEIPEITYFELNGGKKTYTDLAMVSSAQTTKLSELIINNSSSYSLDVKSEEVLLNAVSVTSTGTSLALSCDGAIVSLYKDTRLISNSAIAIVCKNATFSSHTVDGVIGTLDVSGNIYVVGESGNVKENTCPYFVTVTNGEIIAIEEDLFDGFAKGMNTVTFDSNGGSVDKTSISVDFDAAIGTLPVPTREGFEFIGWFDENGNQIYAETKVDEDFTVKAHWLSDYVLEEKVPQDAEITEDAKWEYDLTETKESSQDYLEGYTLYDTTWEWGEYGSWSAWQKADISESEEIKVETRRMYSYYYYLCKNCGYHHPWQQYCKCGHYVNDWNEAYFPIPHTNADSHIIDGSTWYERSDGNGPEYNEYRFCTREKIYTYHHKKTSRIQSPGEIPTYPENYSVSNVQKLVRYIVK